MNRTKVAAIVLAAGEGKRLVNKPEDKNKVALEVGGKPMIAYTIIKLHNLRLFDQLVVVVGFRKESVMAAVGNTVDYAHQEQRLGTGHAVECALPSLDKDIEYVLVINGDDSAFIPAELLQSIVHACTNSGSAISLLTLIRSNTTGLGRIVRDKEGRVQEIIEERHLTDSQKKIKETNSGVYCFNREFLQKHIGEIKLNPVKKERYITDIIALARKHGQKIVTLCIEVENLWQGVNTDEEYTQIRTMIEKTS